MKWGSRKIDAVAPKQTAIDRIKNWGLAGREKARREVGPGWATAKQAKADRIVAALRKRVGMVGKARGNPPRLRQGREARIVGRAARRIGKILVKYPGRTERLGRLGKTLSEYGVAGMKWGVSTSKMPPGSPDLKWGSPGRPFGGKVSASTSKMPWDRGRGSMKGAFQRIPAKDVSVHTGGYRFAHGKNPRGTGKWAFDFGSNRIRFVRGQQSFGAAAKQAKRLASRAGIRNIKVSEKAGKVLVRLRATVDEYGVAGMKWGTTAAGGDGRAALKRFFGRKFGKSFVPKGSPKRGLPVQGKLRGVSKRGTMNVGKAVNTIAKMWKMHNLEQ
jgi:hypothetical protein